MDSDVLKTVNVKNVKILRMMEKNVTPVNLVITQKWQNIGNKQNDNDPSNRQKKLIIKSMKSLDLFLRKAKSQCWVFCSTGFLDILSYYKNTHQIPNFQRNCEKHSLYSLSALRNSLQRFYEAVGRFLCAIYAVCVLRNCLLGSISHYNLESASLLKWYYLAGVLFPSDVYVPTCVFCAFLLTLCLQVSPLQRCWNPSDLRSRLLKLCGSALRVRQAILELTIMFYSGKEIYIGLNIN